MFNKERIPLIISEIQKHYNIKSDSDFAMFLGITPQNLSNWKQRGSLNFEILSTKCVDIDMNWVLTGEGAMLKHIPLDRKEQPLDNFLQDREPDKIYKRNYSKQEQETIEDASGTQLLKLKLEHAESTIQALQQTIELQKKMIEFLTK